MEKMKITTKTGFKLEVDKRVFEDYRFVDAIAKANTDSLSEIQATTEIVNLLFGDKKKDFIEHIAKKNDGFAPSEVVKDEVLFIMKEYKSLKNSSSSEG